MGESRLVLKKRGEERECTIDWSLLFGNVRDLAVVRSSAVYRKVMAEQTAVIISDDKL